MSTKNLGAGTANITGNVPCDVANAVKTRAELLGKSVSWVAGRILSAWYEAGCPQITTAEKQLAEAAKIMREELKASQLDADLKLHGGVKLTPLRTSITRRRTS